MRALGLFGIVLFAASISLTGCGGSTTTVQGPPDGESMIVLTLKDFVDPAPSHYALWASNGSTDELLVRFTVDGGAPVGLDGGSIAVLDQISSLADGTVLKISLEGDTTGAAPGNHVLLAGTLDGGEATLTMGDAAALGVDLTGASGTILLDAPTTTDPHDCRRGIWWTDSEGGATLGVPTLPSSWRYEGWVIDRVSGVPHSTGRFASPTGADSDGAGATASGESAGYPFPGQDFVTATDSIPPLDLDNGLFTARVTLEPEPDNSASPFGLTLLDQNIAAGTLVLDMENLPPLLDGAYYETWIRFDDDSLRSIGGFHWSGNGMIDLESGESVAGLPAPCTLVGGSDLLITVEDESDGDPASSGSVIAAAALGDADTTLSATAPGALGGGYDATEAFYSLATPSTAGETDYNYGIWFFHVDENGDTLPAADLPAAPSGWHYESWVRKFENSPDDFPVSLGTFRLIDSLDSDGAGPNAGADTLAPSVHYPGQDFLVDADNRWISDGHHETTISLEPDDDFSPSTIFLTLFHDPKIVDVGPDTTQAMQGELQALPAGTGTFKATAVYGMESNGDHLPEAKVAVGK